MNMDHSSDVGELLRSLSPYAFLKIGMNEIAYIRMLDNAGAGHASFGLYAADGTQLSIAESFATAVVTARNQDLVPVTLQ